MTSPEQQLEQLIVSTIDLATSAINATTDILNNNVGPNVGPVLETAADLLQFIDGGLEVAGPFVCLGLELLEAFTP